MKNSSFHSYVLNNIVVLFGAAIVSLKAIILMPLIIKNVGIEIYGGYVLFVSMVSIAFGLSSLGAGFRYKRFLPSADISQRQKLFFPQFIFTITSLIFLSLLFILFKDFLDDFIFDQKFDYSIYLIPLYLISYLLFSQGSDYFRYTGRVNYMTIATASFPYLHIILLGLYLYFFNEVTVDDIVLAEILAACLVGSICFISIFKELGFRISIYRVKELVEDIKLGFPLVVNVIIDFLLAASDRFLISIFISIGAVGYYNAPYLLGSLILVISKGMSTVIPQLMSRLVDSGDEVKARVIVNYSIKIFLLFAIPFVFGSFLLENKLLLLLADLDTASQSRNVTPIIALASLFLGLFHILSNIYFVRLKMASMLKLNIIAAISNVVLNLVFLAIFRDIVVAAYTTLASYFLVFVLINRKVRIIWSVQFDIPFIMKSILAAVAMFFICEILANYIGEDVSPIFYISILLLMAISSYLGCLLMMAAFSKKELEFAMKVLRFKRV